MATILRDAKTGTSLGPTGLAKLAGQTSTRPVNQQRELAHKLRKDLAHGKINEEQYNQKLGIQPQLNNTIDNPPENIPKPENTLPTQPVDNTLAQQAVNKGYVKSVDEYNQATLSGKTTADRLKTQYQQGLNNVKQTGAPAPKTQGPASTAINQATPPAPIDTSNIDFALQEDKGYQQLLKDQADYNHVVNQQKTLTDTYNKLIKSAGIDSINTELLNTQKIINGTEDDIRKEVQAVSGFATDSQILALASARNKSLIQNYNNLLDTKKMAMEQVNTMIGLAKEDQQMALNNIINKMGIDEKLMSYRDKFVNNAKEGYKNVISAIGYDGLYKSLVNSGDPTAINLAEKTLGLAPGQLKTIASQPNLDKQIKQAQLANINSEIAKRNYDMQASGMGGVDEKTISKIQSSPEYKTINGVLPSIQALKAYKDAINTYGTTEQLSGTGKGELAGTYGNALATWKSLAGLGALSGADFTLAENAVPSTGFFQRSSTMKAKLNSSIDNAISQAENLTKRLSANYPKAAPLLNAQLDDMKLVAYPDKYTKGPDGQVYEITK